MGVVFKNDRVSVEYLRQRLTYDPLNGELRWKFNPDANEAWNSSFAGKRAGTHKKGYVQIVFMIDKVNHFFGGHRIAWAMHYGQWPDGRLDHEDNNGLNNAILNLRPATTSENGCNRDDIRGAVPYKGVYYVRKMDRFAAQIKIRKRWKWLGLHVTAELAAAAYDAAAIELHGQFAKTNAAMGLLR